MIVDAVTTRWSGALYGLAVRHGVLPAVVADVERLGAEIARPEVRHVLLNPRLDPATRRGALDGALRGAHVLTANFVGLLFDRGREAVLSGLAQAFRRRILLENDEVEGVVESARPMDQATMERVSADVGRALGKKLILKNRVVPELVGGARVIAGNRMLDGSVQGHLDALRLRLLQAPLPH